ncbi:MAG TPA: glycosyltransferase family 4 protein [Chthoniobacteraceae bacterium]|nr:glycosyltransferase family 4 protein [Chthoniobacteraceae bacterium]
MELTPTTTPLATPRVAFVGNYLPRRCGIATFTADLCEAVAAEFPETDCLVGAMNEGGKRYEYPERVRFEISEPDLASYRRAADFLNLYEVDVVSIQHEFGIFGGPAGSHLLTFLKALHSPVVTTLHTVLAEPTGEQREVMKQLDKLSNRFVVMAEKGRDLAESVYGIPRDRIDVIPHGVLDVPFIDPHFYKDHFGAVGKTVMLTFGLLSPNKGIEHAISALPAIIRKHPEVVYHIVGATHPHLLAHEGEAYRERLQKLVNDLGLSDRVVFHNRFVDKEELMIFIGGADIYVTPYLNEAQITSGTLAYAFGAGKAVISTPYWHAQELLGDDRGILVPFADAEAIAEGVDRFLSDPALMTGMRKHAWELGREMIWPEVAQRYMESFDRARTGLTTPIRGMLSANVPESTAQLPAFKLDHLCRMTDNTGLFQHAIYHVPRYSDGYCVDDNARALILTTLLEETALFQGQAGGQYEGVDLGRLRDIYLSFLWDSFVPETGRFRNFMSHRREWLEPHGSEDSHGRALWAMGTVLGRSRHEGARSLCARLFHQGLPELEGFSSPRAWAFGLLAIHEYLRRYSGDTAANRLRHLLTQRLVKCYHAHCSPEWKWFEPEATYDNAKLSHALILSGQWTSQGDVLEIGLTSLRWLLEAQTAEEGHFSAIGCNGFWKKGKARARFDQQPLEAQSMVSACLEAYGVTGKTFWLMAARRCFAWFLGHNDLREPLYDATTGGCCDALEQDRVNRNQGAESSLALYLSLAELKRFEAMKTLDRGTRAA